MGGGESAASEDPPALLPSLCIHFWGSCLGPKGLKPLRTMCVLWDEISSRTIFFLLSEESLIHSK